MIKMPKVTIVMPTYNRAELLKEAIKSILSQTFKDWQLVVIDDGSSDYTKEVVKRFAAQNPRIQYVHQNNQGVTQARARTVEFVTGEYVTFLDDDDLYYPNKLNDQVNFLDQHPEVGLVYSFLEMVDRDKKLIMKWPYQQSCSFSELVKDNVIQPNAALLRSQCLKKLGSFCKDLKSADDYEMWLRIAKHYPIAFLPVMVGCYRWHDSNMSYDKRKRCQSNVDVFKVVMSYRLSGEEREQVFKRVIELTYTKGSDAFHSAEYGEALFYFLQALRFSKLIGLHVAWGRHKNFVYGLIRPYLAILFSLMLLVKSHLSGGIKRCPASA